MKCVTTFCYLKANHSGPCMMHYPAVDATEDAIRERIPGFTFGPFPQEYQQPPAQRELPLKKA
jgi:hypothetical protein